MMKRVFAVAMAACLLMLPMAVRADTVMGNEFLHQNEDKAEPIGKEYLGRQFIVNSPEGFVIPKTEPGSKQGVSTERSYKGTSPGSRDDKPYTFAGDVFIFENGEMIRITHTFPHGGRYWGVMSYSHTYQPSGWIPMDELLVLYDGKDFEDQYEESFYAYDGDYATVFAAEKLVEWDWPGADTEKRIVEDRIIDRALVFYAYRDADGREWGKSGYSGQWICLSDPEDRGIPAFNPSLQTAAWSPDGVYDWSAAVTEYPPVDISSSPSVHLDAQPLDLDGQPFPWRTVLPFAAAVVVGAVLGFVVVTLRRRKQK